jgi:hypothetical protein
MTEEETAKKIVDWFQLLRMTTDERAREAIQQQIAALVGRRMAQMGED